MLNELTLIKEQIETVIDDHMDMDAFVLSIPSMTLITEEFTAVKVYKFVARVPRFSFALTLRVSNIDNIVSFNIPIGNILYSGQSISYSYQNGKIKLRGPFTYDRRHVVESLLNDIAQLIINYTVKVEKNK